jgi:hypothetical protein
MTMPDEEIANRNAMIDLLERIVGSQPLPDDLQRMAMQVLLALVEQPRAEPTQLGTPSSASPSAVMALDSAHSAASVGNRRLVYVHGICEHAPRFSDPWWEALRPFVSNTFGSGALGDTRLEVVWSDLVNRAVTALAVASSAPETGELSDTERDRHSAAEEIKEALRDHIDQHMLRSASETDGGPAAAAMAADSAGLVSIPGLSCVDDFAVYLIDDGVRQQIINRFANVVRPQLQASHLLDVVGHSWGTVVAYEGLRRLEDEGLTAPLVRNFFTVGAALSLGPVKRRLRAANQNGRKPANAVRWINLDASGDLVGGPLKGRPFSVDFDFLNLTAVGCSSVVGIVDPLCAHSSYFHKSNADVNQGIFARFISLSY